LPAQVVGQKRDAPVPGFDARVRLAGVGLHTGRACAVVLNPGAPGRGWTLNGAPVATLAVADTFLATTLETPSGPVMTVEHVFAALAGAGVADVEITVEGPEVPALDGSAAPFVAALRRAGWVTPGFPTFGLAAPFTFESGAASFRVEPSRSVRLEVELEPALVPAGQVHFARDLMDFAVEWAPARTFGRLADAATLHARGRALGASLETCLVFDSAGAPLNPGGLRFPDEPARHKALDLLGDLARLGALPRATIHARFSGHASHAALACRLALVRPPVPA
jgi:UDP-3-O-[3-hydroxymyristoyl] N-acetylglucosamine deacetylase